MQAPPGDAADCDGAADDGGCVVGDDDATTGDEGAVTVAEEEGAVDDPDAQPAAINAQTRASRFMARGDLQGAGRTAVASLGVG
jgi:hypothetical protein